VEEFLAVTACALDGIMDRDGASQGVCRHPFRSMGFVRVIITTVLFALGLPTERRRTRPLDVPRRP